MVSESTIFIFGTWEEDVEALSGDILTNEDVENVERDLVEQVRDNLEDQRHSVIVWRERFDIVWEID